MSVDKTYCLDEWKDTFIEKPLSFLDFVKETDLYKNKTLFTHTLDAVEEISNWRPDETPYIYMQTCVGSGKTTLIHLLLAYKCYLFTLLKSPSDYFGLSNSTQYIAAISGKKKLVINSLENFFSTALPMFERVNDIDNYNGKKIGWSLSVLQHDLVIKAGNSKNKIYIDSFTVAGDLLGKNVVIGIMSDLDSLYYGDSERYKLYESLKARISSRLRGENVVSLCLLESEPHNIKDQIDEEIEKAEYSLYNNFKVIRYKPIWKLRPGMIKPNDEMVYLNLKTLAWNPKDFVEKTFPETIQYCVEVPLSIIKNCGMNIERVVRDYIGYPIGYIPGGRDVENLLHVKQFMNDNGLEIVVSHGEVQIMSNKTGRKLDLYDRRII